MVIAIATYILLVCVVVQILNRKHDKHRIGKVYKVTNDLILMTVLSITTYHIVQGNYGWAAIHGMLTAVMIFDTVMLYKRRKHYETNHNNIRDSKDQR